MSSIWKLGVRSILAFGFTGILMFASGCDGGGGVSTDTTPDAFSFTAQTVALSTVITSNAITVAGINSPAPISITGGNYSISGGAYTAIAGTVTNGQTVTVQHTSSAANSTVTTTTLTIGGVSAAFTSTTVAAAGVDTTPDAFTFTDQTGVALSTLITSAPITVSGINSPAPISITGGTYSIDGVTSTAGTVTNNQTVAVQHTSSATNGAVTTTTLTIGGVSDIFTSTTIAATPVCGTCHAIPPATGQHVFHVTTQNIDCLSCHGPGYSATTVNATTHNNGTVDLDSTIGWNGTTCATPGIGCHGGGRVW